MVTENTQEGFAVDAVKKEPDYLVSFACEDCGFSTKSGLAAQAHVDWEKEQDRLYRERDDKTAKLGIQKTVDALNSYNPDRDELARELARRLLFSPYYKILHPQARQLLRLYQEASAKAERSE